MGAGRGRGLEPKQQRGRRGWNWLFPEAHWGSEQLGGRGLGGDCASPHPAVPRSPNYTHG